VHVGGLASFSWRLILAPPYVAGLSRRPRSRAPGRDEPLAAILAGVGRVCDHVERAKKWLDTSGNDLHRYGVQD